MAVGLGSLAAGLGSVAAGLGSVAAGLGSQTAGLGLWASHNKIVQRNEGTRDIDWPIFMIFGKDTQ